MSIITDTKLIAPHGGTLIDRTGERPDDVDTVEVVTLTSRELSDLDMLASGASEEPPMPSRTNVSNFVRDSAANSTISPARSCIRFGSSSQPSHLSSSAPVQTVASRAQIRSTSSCCVAMLIGCSLADERWKGRKGKPGGFPALSPLRTRRRSPRCGR